LTGPCHVLDLNPKKTRNAMMVIKSAIRTITYPAMGAARLTWISWRMSSSGEKREQGSPTDRAQESE
jgi:hypothetical protein